MRVIFYLCVEFCFYEYMEEIEYVVVSFFLCLEGGVFVRGSELLFIFKVCGCVI